jgi:hypothetical protein
MQPALGAPPARAVAPALPTDPALKEENEDDDTDINPTLDLRDQLAQLCAAAQAAHATMATTPYAAQIAHLVTLSERALARAGPSTAIA